MRYKAEIGAMVSLVGYTIARFVAAGGTLSKYGVDARWFLFWDIVTVPPYVWSIGRLVRGLARPEPTPFGETAGWSLLALASFLAPYGYLFYAGAGEFPPLAWILLTLLVGLFAANAVRSVRKRVAIGRAATASA
jgi:hypothetical protein